MGQTTEVIRNQIFDLISQRPMTYQEISEAIGMSYKTIFTRMQELKSEGRAAPVGRRGHQDLWQSNKPQLIPLFPITPHNFVNPLTYIYRLADTTGGVKPSKLEKLLRTWPQTFVGIFRSAAIIKDEEKFNPERHRVYKDYMLELKAELELKLRQVNSFLMNEKFWDRESLTEFTYDATFNSQKIIDAHDKAVIYSNRIEEYK